VGDDGVRFEREEACGEWNCWPTYARILGVEFVEGREYIYMVT
jgi:hypothetical protein